MKKCSLREYIHEGKFTNILRVFQGSIRRWSMNILDVESFVLLFFLYKYSSNLPNPCVSFPVVTEAFLQGEKFFATVGANVLPEMVHTMELISMCTKLLSVVRVTSRSWWSYRWWWENPIFRADADYIELYFWSLGNGCRAVLLLDFPIYRTVSFLLFTYCSSTIYTDYPIIFLSSNITYFTSLKKYDFQLWAKVLRKHCRCR